MPSTTQYFAFHGMLTEDPEAAYPISLFAIFQGLFCVITVALIGGMATAGTAGTAPEGDAQ